MGDYRSISKPEETAKKGAIFERWTQTWGLIVYPWYDMDKLKFSFVEVGQAGKGKSFDICMDCRRDDKVCFDDWAYDILNDRRAERILAAEKTANEKYPKYFRFTTGENGDKVIGICNSTSSAGGYCINAQNPGADGKKVFANIQVDFHAIRHLAENFKRTYRKRQQALDEMLDAAARKTDEFHKENGMNRLDPGAELTILSEAPEKREKEESFHFKVRGGNIERMIVSFDVMRQNNDIWKRVAENQQARKETVIYAVGTVCDQGKTMVVAAGVKLK